MDTELSVFLSRVKVVGPNDCWEFTRRSGHGYGGFNYHGRFEAAHRAAYRLLIGPIPEGHIIHHNCPGTANKLCCNPAHLVLTTRSKHTFIDPGMNTYINRNKTHCKNGHEFSPENTRVNKKGQRLCRECLRLKARKGTGNKFKTHCKNGHPFDETNTVFPPDGSRQCKICLNLRARRYYTEKHPDAKGRTGRPKGVNLKTHCPKGHPLEGENLITDGYSRRCRICKNDRQRADYQKRIMLRR